MGPLDQQNIVYKINGLAASVKEHTKSVYVSGFGDSAIFVEESLGWFLHLNGSHEAIFIGWATPNIKRGDVVTITIKKEPDALPHPTSK